MTQKQKDEMLSEITEINILLHDIWSAVVTNKVLAKESEEKANKLFKHLDTLKKEINENA